MFKGAVGKVLYNPFAKIGGSNLQEGGEEAAQDVISRFAKGDPINWDPAMQEQFVVGAMMGGLFGGVGAVKDHMDKIQNRVLNKMDDQTKAEYNDMLEQARSAGVPEEQAHTIALDMIADHPIGQEWIKSAVKEHQDDLGLQALAKATVDPLELMSQNAIEQTNEIAQHANMQKQAPDMGSDELVYQAPDADKQRAYQKQYESLQQQMKNAPAAVPGGLTHDQHVTTGIYPALDFQKYYTCYYPDFRGHGRTRCESLEWSTPQLVEDTIDFMNSLSIARAHFIGYSLGANVGLYCAVRHPERVATLTTIGSSGFADPTGVEQFEPEWLIENGKHETINQMLERHEEAHRGNWQEHMRQAAKDWRLFPQLTKEQLSGIHCPSLFITGEHDPFVGEEKIKYLSSLVEGSQYLVVQGGSHRPHMAREQPVLVNDTILHFLQSYPLQ